MNESPDLRIADADREHALSALGEHTSVGRLTIDEYGERSARVTAAKTRGELLEVFADLPEPHPKFGTPWATVEKPAPKQPLTWVDRPASQRMFAAGIPLLFVAAVILGITTGIWWFMAVPFVATAVGRGLWGHEWERDRHGNRDRRDRRRELRDR